VNPNAIVKALDISEQIAPRGIAIGVFARVDEFGFQCAKETLHRRIVPAICVTVYRLAEGGSLQDVAIRTGGVWADSTDRRNTILGGLSGDTGDRPQVASL
jgi:hypothetical protein